MNPIIPLIQLIIAFTCLGVTIILWALDFDELAQAFFAIFIAFALGSIVNYIIM